MPSMVHSPPVSPTPPHDPITTTTTPRPPLSSFYPHIPLTITLPDAANPAPTPPPRSPLPALPPNSPRFDMDFGSSTVGSSSNSTSSAPLLNLAGRTSSSSGSSWHRHQPNSSLPYQSITTETRGWDGMDDAAASVATTAGTPGALSEETVSDAFLLQSLLQQHGHESLDQWHNRQFGSTSSGVGLPFHVTDSELGHTSPAGDDHPPSLTPEAPNILAAYPRDLARQQVHQAPSSYPRPRSRAHGGAAKSDRRVSPPSASTSSSSLARTPATPSSRSSVASDLVSLSETSKSLMNLSKRLSGSYSGPMVADSRQSLDGFDPFEFDRFDDLKSSASSIKSRSARSSPSDLSRAPANTPRRSESSRSSYNKRLSTASSQYLPIPNPNTTTPHVPTPVEQPIMIRPPMPRSTRSGAGASQDLFQKSMDLADKRANLEARRAELLGLPPPAPRQSMRSTAIPPMSPSERQTEFPPPLRRLNSGRPPPRLVLDSGEASPRSFMSAATTSSFKSVSSASTARPGIVLRPSSASDSGLGSASPQKHEFEFSSETWTLGGVSAATTPHATQFSPSSMTFGGDCHRSIRHSRPASPPPPVPSKRVSDLPPPPLPSKSRESVPPPPPPKDGLVSPDINALFATRAARIRHKGADRSSFATTDTTSMSSLRQGTKVRRVADLADRSSRRLSHVSSTGSLRTRNFSYPSDAAPFVEAELEEEDEDEFGPDAYYYSHAQGRIASTGSSASVMQGTRSAPAELVEGWAQRDVAFRNLRESVVLEEDMGDSSDSSLDLHTPLPDMLVRAGVLSSRSALIAAGGDNKGKKEQTDADKDVSSGKTKEEKAAELAKGVRGKVISRNRLVRHRDGKNLGLGLGLTTGLGWSDSEDEDAPSPLRRHISQVILTKKTSQGSISTLASSTSISNFGSRHESVLSATTVDSARSGGIKSRGSSNSTTTAAGGLSRLRTTNLKGSQSMAQISPSATSAPSRIGPMTRQASMPAASHTVGPPSSFALPRSKAPSSSQQSSISSLGSILHPPPFSSHSGSIATRSPSSSSTSISTASSNFSPITPASSHDNSPATDSVLTLASSSPALSGTKGFSLSTSEHGVLEKPARPDIRRVASSSAATAAFPPSSSGKTASVRSRASSHAMPPPSSFGKPFPGSSGSSASSSASVTPRARTISSGSQQSSGIPAPRARTTSTGSVATSVSGGLRSKSSMASLKSVAHSISSPHAPALPSPSSFAARHARQTSSTSSILLPPLPPLDAMTVGSLAFPSPPPLSPAVVGMRLAQAQAHAGVRKSSLSRASITSRGTAR